jgi:ParB-like chromosome segregation protein Spo0J
MGLDLEAQATVRTILDALEPLWGLPLEQQVQAMNEIRRHMHSRGPFAAEPVDLVEWVPADSVQANDYNPNTVAPPEMRLLEHSIAEDGYTQPIVTHNTGDAREVVDGFHRNRIGKTSQTIHTRIRGYLPVTTIRVDRTGRADRIAATIRHNRARGKHGVEAMSSIVMDLSRRNWSDKRIATELGMDADEVLRLKQITGLTELFADREFSEAWEAG